jgi:hypothetical protein
MRSFAARVALAALLFTAGTITAVADGFRLTSTDLSDGTAVPLQFVHSDYGCGGDNESPALSWHGAPQGTRSFAVTVFDPDAPTGHGWWHWAVANLPPSTTVLPRGSGNAQGHALPESAVQLRNDFGNARYGGPCPPPGAPHRYRFRVYAVDVARLPVHDGDPAPSLETALQGHILGMTQIVARYAR